MTIGENSLEATEIVEHSLLPVPLHARTSTVAHQFWIWTGANLAPINWVLGALGISLGLSLWQTISVLVAGNIIGMAAFGFFVLMGQRTGVSQMVLSRSTFGRRGAYLAALLQGGLAAGWCAVNTWVILDLVVALFGKLGYHGGLDFRIGVAAFIMAVQVWIAAIGFRAIARFERWTVPVTLVVFALMSAVAWSKSGVHWHYQGQGLHGAALWSALSTVMTAIGVGWGITWFAYAADYSRFVSPAIPARKVYLASVLGQIIPTVWLGIFGATLATVSQTVDPGQLVVNAFGFLAIPVILLVLHGPIATNILNLYSCGLCAQTLDWQVDRRKLSYGIGIASFAFTIYLIIGNNFAASLDGWLSGLVTWVAPWAAITLIHYYGVMRGQVDTVLLFDPPGSKRLKDISWPAIAAFGLGMVATWACEYGMPSYLQGPIATAMGGVDLSWLAGAVVGGGSYVGLLKLARPQPVVASVAESSSFLE